MTWDRASSTARTTAAARAATVALVQDRVAGGAAVADALRAVAADADVSVPTLRRWVARAAAAGAAGQVATAGLVDRPRAGRPATVWMQPGAEDAWRLWQVAYLRLEKPSAAGCWETVRRVGVTRGWRLPSVQAFLRRLRAETPAPQIVRAREGRLAALATYPFQRRTVADLAPLELVNGDGYRHNIFVIPEGGGKPFRPLTWFWQDVRTRKMLAWRSGPTESADLIRLSLHDLVVAYGVPGGVLLDNTRAASTKWFGGSNCRWRADQDEPVQGILDVLGIRVVHTGVEHEVNGKARGHGWAKPVERAFRDLGETVDKHPWAAGAYTGRSPAHKPANYDEDHALTWEQFVGVLADGMLQHDARPGRETEAAAGRSFEATWAAEIATTPVRRLTRAQQGLLLLAVESTKIKRSGVFTLAAGRAAGLPQNEYWHPDLVAVAGRRIVARFDPQNLHGGVEVFDAQGRWLCRADCRLPVGVLDTVTAKRTNRERRAWQRNLDKADAARERLEDVLEQYDVQRPVAPPAPVRESPKLVRMTPDAPARPDTARRKELERRRDRGLQRVAEAR